MLYPCSHGYSLPAQNSTAVGFRVGRAPSVWRYITKRLSGNLKTPKHKRSQTYVTWGSTHQPKPQRPITKALLHHANSTLNTAVGSHRKCIQGQQESYHPGRYIYRYTDTVQPSGTAAVDAQLPAHVYHTHKKLPMSTL